MALEFEPGSPSDDEQNVIWLDRYTGELGVQSQMKLKAPPT